MIELTSIIQKEREYTSKTEDKYPDVGCLTVYATEGKSHLIGLNRKATEMLGIRWEDKYSDMRIAIVADYGEEGSVIVGATHMKTIPRSLRFGTYNTKKVAKNGRFQSKKMHEILQETMVYDHVDSTSTTTELFLGESVGEGVFEITRVPPVDKGEEVNITLVQEKQTAEQPVQVL